MAPSRVDVVTLAEHRTYALCNGYEVDGRVSWHPPSARGFAPFNCFVFLNGNDALLVDTGLTVHEASVLAQLRELLEDGSQLSVAVLRQGEFDSLCNLTSVVRQFSVEQLYGQFDDVVGWSAFRPEYLAETLRLREQLPTTVIRGGDTVRVGEDRGIRVLRPLMRLLTTLWMFDEETGMLCTSDMFSHTHTSGVDGPWIVTGACDATTYEDVRDHMLGTRYWWIPDASTDDLRRDLAGIFEGQAIRCIAPAWGCLLSGEDVVARHYEMVDRVLREEGRNSGA